MTKLNKIENTLNAKLFVRIIPTTDINYDLININECEKVLYVRCLQDLEKNVNFKDPHYWAFCTDGVFWNSSQDKVYETVTSGLYDDIFNGVNAIILSFGQTSSGKTTTTTGLRFQFQSRGLALRILSQLFEEAKKRSDFTKINFGLSYVEFCGENLKDLLSNKSLNNVRDVPEYTIQDEEWAWHQIFNAECRKSYVDDAPYKGSNRCHSILTFYIHSESLVDTDPIVSHSKIHLVDMAGYGNFGDEAAAWKNRLDLAKSNLTKTYMEQLIICLKTEKTEICDNHVCPYKSSRFLLYLNDALNPKSLIRFVAHVYGNITNLPLTISTLKFGVKIRDFKPAKLQRIIEFNYKLHMKNLEKEYQQLKDEVVLSGMLQDSPDYGNISQDRLHQIRRAATDYLLGELDSLTLLSLGQANLTLEVFKDLYQKLLNEKEQIVKETIASAKEMIQNHLSNEKNGSVSTLPSHRTSKRRSRQHESQNLLGTSNRSNDSGQNSSTRLSSMPQQVGFFDKKGISIGPGKTSSAYEGNITKAFKKLKSKRSDSFLNKVGKKISTKDFGTTYKAQAEDTSELSLPQEVPTRESAWQNFFNENPDLVSILRSNAEKSEMAATNAKQKYLNTLAELSKMKREIEVIKSDLENCQHIHQICNKGEFDEDGNPLPGELEKELMNLLTEKQGQLNVIVENCHVALIDLKSFVEKLSESKQLLEEAFQKFCKSNYKIIFPEEATFSQLQLVEGKEILGEKDIGNENLKQLYYFLQQKLFDYVPPKKKKEWKKY